MFGKILNPQKKGGCLPDPIMAGLPVVNEIVGEYKTRPRKFSLRDKMPQIGNQLNYDCVGWAGTYIGEFFEKKESGYKDFSAMALFSLAKLTDGMSREQGTYLSMSTYIPEKYGYFLEEHYPEFGGGVYEIKEVDKPHALDYKLKSSVLVERGDQDTFDGLKEMLAKLSSPIAIGITVWENFYPDSKGVIPPAKGNGKFGHAMTAVGYDDDKQLLEVANSWGNKWGNDGYCYLPYGYPVFSTCWTGYDLPNDWQKPKPPGISFQRDLAKEQRNAEFLKASIYKAFKPWDSARVQAMKDWFLLINACTYFGYTYTDLTNWLYAKSRNKGEIFNLTKNK